MLVVFPTPTRTWSVAALCTCSVIGLQFPPLWYVVVVTVSCLLGGSNVSMGAHASYSIS